MDIGNWKLEILATQAGQSLIELMVTIGLFAVLLPALLIGFMATRSGRVAILSAKPLDPDVMAKIADCLAKGSWS